MGRKRVKHNAIPKSISLYEYEWAEIDKISQKSRSTAIRKVMARSKAYEATNSLESASLLMILNRVLDSQYLSDQLDKDLKRGLASKRNELRAKANELEMLYQEAKRAD